MRRTLINTLLCCLALVFSSCMKETGETILLPVKSKRIPVTVLTEEQQKELAEYFPIHEGDTPPDIAGFYITAPMQLVYASDGYHNDFYDLRWNVEPLDWWNHTVYSEWQNTASGTTIEAHVIGKDSEFTLYTISHVVNEDENWNCDLVTLVSGRKSDEGIANYHYAIVMFNKHDDNGQLMGPDYYRIFIDGDGLAERRDEQ